MNVSHMQYYFPLDSSVQLNIFPTTLNVIFNIKHIILPVFQRKYCWTEKQFKLYWKDLNDVCFSYQTKKHHIGKFTVFEKNDKIVVLDGQQRITTTLIIFIAIRDEFIKYNKNRNNPKINTIITTINRILFNNITLNNKIQENDEQKEEKKEENEPKICEGERLDFIRFLPTYSDREPLYNLILNNDKYQQYIKNNDGKNNNIYNAKTYFDDRVANIINGTYNNNKLNQLKNLYNELLTKFTFVYVGIPIEHWNKAFFIYQWLFEKSLLSAVQITNKRPGEKHLSSDLFKNYILSFFISKDMEKQEQIYNQWLEMEKCFNSQKQFDQYLLKSIGSTKEEPYAGYQDLVKMLENKLNGIQEIQYPLIIEQFLIGLKQNAL